MNGFYSCASNVQFYELKDDFNARFIVDGVQAARMAFLRSVDELRKELESAGLEDKKIDEILSKRNFSLQYALENKLLP